MSKFVENGAIGASGGNTKPRVNPSKYWLFTLNNYTCDEMVQLNSMFVSLDAKFIIGEEVGEKCGTPHLQGYVEFPTKVRPVANAAKVLGHSRIHWEKRRGTREQNIKYCAKEGNYSVTGLHVPTPTSLITYGDLRDRQRAIADLYSADEDPKFGRKIHWYYEKLGGWGKSILAAYLHDQKGALVLSGKSADCKYAIMKYVEEKGEGPKIVVIDIPRTSMDYVNYEAIESIKNGLFFSSKYESGICRFNRPWLIVFANCAPEWGRMSADRWQVVELGHDGKKKDVCPPMQAREAQPPIF